MLRFPLVRKLLKTWNRCYGTRRERTPSSLQECLDHPSPKKGLWRNWFVFLIIIPILYFIIFVGSDSKFEEYSVPVKKQKLELRESRMGKEDNIIQESQGEKEENNLAEVLPSERQQKSESQNAEMKTPRPSYYQIQRPRANPKPSNIMDFHEHPKSSKKVYSIENGTLIAKLDGNNTFLGRVSTPARHQFLTTTGKSVPRKFMPICVGRLSKIRNDNTAVKARNVTEFMAYRKKLYKGGFYAPGTCKPRHKVAILVAYRDRRVNLATFIYHIHPFLIDQGLEYRIFVIEQSGEELFNKGRLLNAGYVEAQKYGSWHCLVFHDVDLLPTDMKILYSCPTWPRHMSATIVGKQNNPYFRSMFGGVTSMSVKHFVAVNGYSNMFWGWGGEDSDMFWRIKSSRLPIVRYSKTIAKYLALPHKQGPENPIRKQLMISAKERLKSDGLSNLVYKLVSVTLYQTYTHFLVDVNPEHENITEFHAKFSDV